MSEQDPNEWPTTNEELRKLHPREFEAGDLYSRIIDTIEQYRQERPHTDLDVIYTALKTVHTHYAWGENAPGKQE
jgi:Ser-tRNA(Ala) deacylase AlaX